MHVTARWCAGLGCQRTLRIAVSHSERDVPGLFARKIEQAGWQVVEGPAGQPAAFLCPACADTLQPVFGAEAGQPAQAATKH